MFHRPPPRALLAFLSLWALFGVACTGTAPPGGDAAAPDAHRVDADIARDAGRPFDADIAPDADIVPDAGSPFDGGSICDTGLLACGGECIDPEASPAHCGGCGVACASDEVCDRGVCAAECIAPEERCTDDGIERCVDTRSDVAHCGACGAACALPQSTAACVDGACSIASCDPGFADCNGAPGDGCETDTRATLASCGACGASCALANAMASCTGGACDVAGCNAGFEDCNGDPADGCEVDVRSVSAHCGACGNACPAGFFCAAGTCASSCTAPRSLCGAGAGECVDTRTSTEHCGSCGAACMAPNASPRCAAGSCAIGMCLAGYGDCNGAAADGCEINTRTDPAHCGSCGRTCSVRNASAACASGSCAIAACNAGFGDCNGSAADGCETATATSTNHCGGCGTRCTVANGTPRCTSGACAIASCSFGFADCNGAASDGCEIDTRSSVAHCGGCGSACPARPNTISSCSGSTCRYTCASGFTDCNGNTSDGCETAGLCPPPPDRCEDPITVPPAALGLDPFYRKYLDAAGIPVLSSSGTSDAALRVACRIVRAMVLPRADLRAAMIARGGRVGVMARDEVTTDIPEHADLYTAFPGVDWDTRARGLGATVARPITTCAEENLLGEPTDPYLGENILVHELSHGIFNLGVVFTISNFATRLDAAFSAALAAGRWDMTYAATNRDEYFAEGVQSYFDVNLEASPPNGIHNHVDTRAELLAYDPALHALIAEIFPGATLP